MKGIDVRSDDVKLYSAAVRVFRSYYAAAASIGVGTFQESWDAQRVRRDLAAVGRRGPVTRRAAGTRLVNAAIRYYGSFAAAKRRANVD